MTSENTTKELPARTFLKSLYNNDALKVTGNNRPASAIEHKHNSYTRISEGESKDSFLDTDKDVRMSSPCQVKPFKYEIPEKYRGKIWKRKKHRKIK